MKRSPLFNNTAISKKVVSQTPSHLELNRESIKKEIDVMKKLVHYGTLAANSHNSQPWKFQISTNKIILFPDYTRRCPVVDPDDHHLFASLGCATENIVLAAEAYGLEPHVVFNQNDEAIYINFEATNDSKSNLFLAIPKRQCTRSIYDGRTISKEDLTLLKTAAENYAVSIKLFTGKKALEDIIKYVVEANTQQMSNPAFNNELKHWIRFNESSAIRHGDGLFTALFSRPSILTWLGNLIFKRVLKVESENNKYRNQIQSSSTVIAFISASDDKKGWINVGRSYQRTALQATALGIKHAFINQAIEDPIVRSQFAQFLNVSDKRPDLLIRLGYAHDMPKSLRRPLNQVIIK